MRKKEGIRRLSITVGAVAAVCAFLAIGIESDSVVKATVWALILSIGGWGLVRLVAWVIDGFTGPSPR